MEVAVEYLVEKLVAIGRENIELIAGAENDFDRLREDLGDLNAFLEDASRMDRNSETWKKTVKKIRLVVYKAEDAVDKFLVDANKHLSKNPAVQYFDIPYWLSLKNVAAEIKVIRNEVQELRTDNQHVLNEALKNYQPNLIAPIKQNLAEEDDVVGLTEVADTVIKRLITGGSKGLETVPVVGMAGLGKSTLTNKVFKDKRIALEFCFRIWVDVSDNNNTNILLSMLSSLNKRKDAHERMNEKQLTNEVSTCLGKGGRCLIVLDNVYDKYIKDFIDNVFPKNNLGHRMMVTTREEDVGSYFGNIYKLKFLTDDESWLLLKKKVFMADICPSEELKEPGIAIANKCSGLPLAVVVIAGALVGKGTKKQWELVIETMGDCLIDTQNSRSCWGFIKTSYDQLSYDKKVCFLYCATFPRSFDIPAWKLIRLWIAEGFILRDKKLTPEEKAENHLDDLSLKNLVMVKERTADGHIKTCRVHDLLYEFCKKEANEHEYLFQEITPTPGQSTMMLQDSDIYRRISIGSSNLPKFLSSIPKKQIMELPRSFLCFSSEQMKIEKIDMKTIHRAFPMMRVLDVELINDFIMTDELYQLLHLKYVSISVNIPALPKHFDNFCSLETLIIKSNSPGRTFEIKTDIWRMLRLRHLHTNAPAILPSPGGDQIKNSNDSCMQTLSVIAPVSCTKKVFARASNLRKLGIKGDVLELLPRLKDVVELKRLESLKLKHSGRNTGDGVILPKLVYIFPITLRKLTISGTKLKWSEMTKLGQVETLEVLKLKEYAFQGESWEPKDGGFTGLLVLWIDRTNLKTWQASNLSFPKLKRLVLKSCENLEAIPESLADVQNLQEIKLDNPHRSAVRSAKIIEKKLEHRSSSSFGFKLSVFPESVSASEE